MISSPELREGTPAAAASSCKFPDLPRGLDIVRRKLAPGWSWRVVFGQGYVEADRARPAPGPEVRHVGRREAIRKTTDVQVPVGSVTLRCRHLDGRRAVAGWVWRTDKDGLELQRAGLLLDARHGRAALRVRRDRVGRADGLE